MSSGQAPGRADSPGSPGTGVLKRRLDADADGRLHGFAKITRDISERKAHEERIQNLTRQFERRVIELASTNRELEQKSSENESFHGGQVTAASAGPGTGAEFTVRLPIVPADDAEAPGEPGPMATGGRRLRVVVIDDHPDNADLMTLLIEACGHDARAAYSGDAGLSLARAERPDVMFVDVGMPGMNGYDVAAAVRRDPALSTVRLVAVTGYGRDEDRARAMEAGFDLHMVKPVDEAKLRAVLTGFT